MYVGRCELVNRYETSLSPLLLLRLRDAGVCAFIAVGYFGLAWLSTHLTPRLGDVAYFWPAAGFALGVLLIAPRRLLVPFLSALLVAGVIHAGTVTHALAPSLAYAAINAGCLLLGAAVLRRLIGRPISLDRLRNLLLFVLIAPIGANALGAGLGALVSTFDAGASYAQAFRVWWVSDFLGILLVAPLVVAWAPLRLADLRPSPRRALEAAGCFTGLALVAHWAFSVGPATGGGAAPPLTHFLIPFLVWAALRFGTAGQSAAVLLLTLISVWDTMQGLGPFSAAFARIDQSVLYLQIFLMVAAVMTLVGAALMRERLNAQTDAEEWRARYEAAVTASGSILYDMDLGTRSIVWGGNTEGMLGFRPEELGDASAWLARILPDDLGKLQDRTEQARPIAPNASPLEYRVRRKDGTYIDVEDSGRVVRLPKRQAVRLIGFLRDVTEQRRAESERERLDAQLREAQKMEALGTMAGGIAHDFNNILGAILGHGEIALTEIQPKSRLYKHLHAISDAGRRGKALVEDILTFARRGKAQKAAVELEPLVREVRDLLAATIPSNIRLRLDIQDPTVIVEANATQIHQLLMNLATNAVQAMAQAGGELVIELASVRVEQARAAGSGQLRCGRYAVLSVHDSGSGIAPEVRARMFEPFYTTRATGGTGLGLPLVQAITADHDGAIDIETSIGVGTVFRVYLPAAASGAVQAHRTQSHSPRGSGETILVVDDDHAMLELTEEILAALGYEPVGYDNSLKALEAFRSRPERFDAILADELMPDLSGTQLAQRIKALRPGVPVVIASGYGGPDLQQKARDAGVSRVVAKPFESAHIAQALSQALAVARRQVE